MRAKIRQHIPNVCKHGAVVNVCVVRSLSKFDRNNSNELAFADSKSVIDCLLTVYNLGQIDRTLIESFNHVDCDAKNLVCHPSVTTQLYSHDKPAATFDSRAMGGEMVESGDMPFKVPQKYAVQSAQKINSLTRNHSTHAYGFSHAHVPLESTWGIIPAFLRAES